MDRMDYLWIKKDFVFFILYRIRWKKDKNKKRRKIIIFDSNSIVKTSIFMIIFCFVHKNYFSFYLKKSMEEPTKNHRKMLSSEILAASPIIIEKCTAQNNEFKTCQDNNQYKHPQVCVQQAENLENCIFSTYVYQYLFDVFHVIILIISILGLKPWKRLALLSSRTLAIAWIKTQIVMMNVVNNRKHFWIVGSKLLINTFNIVIYKFDYMIISNMNS